MSGVRRDDAPTKLNAPRLRGDDGENSRRGARLEAVLAPPGISFGYPERVEAGIFAGFRHRGGCVHRVAAQMQDADIEWGAQPWAIASLVRVLPRTLASLDEMH